MSQFSFHCVIVAGLAVALSGCGAEGDDNTSSPPLTEILPIVAMDGFSVAAPNKTTHIDLAPYVRGGQATLTSVRYDGSSEKCLVPIKNGLGFDVKTQSGALCDYQFTVSNTQANDYASMKVFSTLAINPILPPLSYAMVLNGENVTFNLPKLLGDDWPTGYSLDVTSVAIQGSEDNLGSVVMSENIIIYTGPNFSGWNRIIYTLTNAVRPNENILGSIYITVSESVNQPPLISKPKYNYNVENSNVVVLTGNIIDINLASFITDPDGQEWQLIVVQSYTATAVPKNPNSITNKNILFSAGTEGEHIISYVLADHFGGYSIGLIQVTVSSKEQSATWNTLNVSNTTYTAPLRYSDGEDTGFSVTPLWDNQVKNTIAGYNVNSAKAYCGTVGTIPTVSEMIALRNTHYTVPTTTGELNKWPAAKPYLVRSDENTVYLGYSIATGATVENRFDRYYLTCIENPNLDIMMLSRQVVADNKVVTIAEITKAPNTNVVLSRVVMGQPNDLTEMDVNIRTTGSGNKLMVTTQSLKSGVYRFKVTNTADAMDTVSSPLITYHADVNTARLAYLKVDINNAKANNVEFNKLTVTILDVNSNPVPNQQVIVVLTEEGVEANTSSLVNSQSSLFTNTNGQVSILVRNSEAETVDVTINYSSAVGNSGMSANITFDSVSQILDEGVEAVE
ncbi:Ig-like domain-containing protein [Aliivibrio fischeri]|uniref:Big-1 domain-containing protein n=1 Tax=Aliivibrio fischeri TaxID=668 RepID=A0A510UN78_ALIFS|nr:Ig-like domain-containing protein [Aliivibrio fischeri]MUK51218.1 hypothetical protein [Aliivibrio fischeri]GEK15916.1 hypothetical protein AFI02nite_39520 [Aliivibrio fischeri]